MSDHERIEELLALEALDALDGDDGAVLSSALRDHGSCTECATLEREYREVAGRLPFSLEPAAPRRDMAGEILTAVRPLAPLPAPSRLRTALLGAAAAALLGVGVLAGYLIAAPPSAPRSSDLAAFLARPDVRVIRFEGDRGNLSAAVAPDKDGYLFGSELPALPEDQVYELWMIRGETPVRGLCVDPGNGSVLRRFDADLSGTDALAVTIEPASCPEEPSTEPVFVAPLRV